MIGLEIHHLPDTLGQYQIKISNHTEGRHSIPLSAAQTIRHISDEKLAQIQEITGHIGIVEYFYGIGIHEATLSCDTFFPFGNPVRKNWDQRLGALFGTGMADLIQQHIAHDLKCRHGEDSIVIHQRPSVQRARQLTRLNLEKRVCYSLREYCERIDESISEQRSALGAFAKHNTC